MKHFIFYFITFIITYFIYVYPFDIIQYNLNSSQFNPYTTLASTAIIYCFVILYLKTKITFLPLRIFVYEGLGVGFISFWIVNISLFLSFLFFNKTKFIFSICLILILILVLYSFTNARKVKVKNITLNSSKVKKKYSFIFISDVHLGTNNISHVNTIIKKINNIDYNFILIGGDLIDSSSFQIESLSIFKKINSPIYFVTGNHEYYIENYKKKLNKLSQFNIKMLKNKSIDFSEMNIIGIDENLNTKDQLEVFKKNYNTSKFNITLVHKPQIWDEIKNKNELMLSGHTHNGQIFPFNKIVQLKFKYVYGLYESQHSNLYVSSGCACWGPKMRLGSENEIIHFNICKL